MRAVRDNTTLALDVSFHFVQFVFCRYFIPISARCELSQNRDLFIPVLSNIIVWFRREENTCKHFLAVNREIECQLGKQQDGQDTKLMHCEKTNPASSDSSNTIHLNDLCSFPKTLFMTILWSLCCCPLTRPMWRVMIMWWCHATPGDNTGAGDTRREGAVNGAENIDNIHSEPPVVVSTVSLRILLGCHMFARGAGAGRGMSDAYQVLMADTQRGRPPGPAPLVCVCVAGAEAGGQCLLL